MRPSITLNRCVAAVALAASLIALNGCSNLSIAPATRNAAGAAPATTWSSGGYNLKTVNKSNGYNEITGINDSMEIVINTTSVLSSGTMWSSYVSVPDSGQYSSFQNITYPNAESTYMYAISNTSTANAVPIEVGYVVYPASNSGDGGELKGTWGVVDNQGVWSLIKKQSSESDCAPGVAELLGFDSTNKAAVGFYRGANCRLEPYKVTTGDNLDSSFIAVPPFWSNTEATGIASNKDTVGLTSATSEEGWFLPNGSTQATVYHYGGGSSTLVTAFNGIARVRVAASESTDVIVGQYVDSTSKTHGLVFTMNTGTGNWATVDGPSGSQFLVVNGINENGDICGWYQQNASGPYSGFVGTPSTGLRKHRSHGAYRED